MSGLRKAVGVCRRVEEERRHWIGWSEDMDWDKTASASGNVVDVTAGNEVHYWSGRRTSNVGHSYFLGMPWCMDKHELQRSPARKTQTR